jgi:hypothetical protein
MNWTLVEIQEYLSLMAKLQDFLGELFEDEVKHLQDRLDLYESQEVEPEKESNIKNQNHLRLLIPDQEILTEE